VIVVTIRLVIEIRLGGKYHHLVALVDEEDEWVTQWKWYAMAHPRTTYVSRGDVLHGRYRVSYLLQREIMIAPCNKEVDHRNGDGLDNRRTNLRLATPAQNARNRPLQSNNTSGVRGVHWCASKGRWRARIKVNNKYIELGLPTDLDSAARVREAAALKYYGEFQRK
jgi:hypothetical protein